MRYGCHSCLSSCLKTRSYTPGWNYQYQLPSPSSGLTAAVLQHFLPLTSLLIIPPHQVFTSYIFPTPRVSTFPYPRAAVTLQISQTRHAPKSSFLLKFPIFFLPSGHLLTAVVLTLFLLISVNPLCCMPAQPALTGYQR